MESQPLALEPITPQLLEEVCAAIVRTIAPEQIILFGSMARGEGDTAHDIDLYVIKRGPHDRREVERSIEKLFLGRLFALDVLVATPEQVEKSINAGNSFLSQEVFQKGRVLCERTGHSS